MNHPQPFAARVPGVLQKILSATRLDTQRKDDADTAPVVVRCASRRAVSLRLRSGGAGHLRRKRLPSGTLRKITK